MLTSIREHKQINFPNNRIANLEALVADRKNGQVAGAFFFSLILWKFL